MIYNPKKNIKKIVVSVVLGLVGVGIAGTAASFDIVPGSSCVAANLNQAEQLGWDQWGTRNPAAIGGPSYFILCPAMQLNNARRESDVQYEIGVSYFDANAQDVTCTLREIDADANPNFIVAATNVTFDTATTANCSSKPCDGWKGVTFTGSTTSSWNHHTLVCAMYPQTRLNYYGAYLLP